MFRLIVHPTPVNLMHNVYHFSYKFNPNLPKLKDFIYLPEDTKHFSSLSYIMLDINQTLHLDVYRNNKEET